MINPGGVPTGTGNKSADTRMANTKTQAARMQVGNNPAAMAVFKKQVAVPSARRNGKVYAQQQVPQTMPQAPQGAMPSYLPEAPLAQPFQGEQDFNPEALIERDIESVVNDARVKQFVNSAPIKNAVTQLQIRDFFNQDKPDQRPLMSRVLERLGTRFNDD